MPKKEKNPIVSSAKGGEISSEPETADVSVAEAGADGTDETTETLEQEQRKTIGDWAKELKSAENDEERKSAMAEYMEVFREAGEEDLRDEILSNARNIIDIDPAVMPEQGDKIDEYLKAMEAPLVKFFNKCFGKEKVDLVEQTVQEVLKGDFLQLARDCINTYLFLLRKGYSKEQINSMLAEEPLSNWKEAEDAVRDIKDENRD